MAAQSAAAAAAPAWRQFPFFEAVPVKDIHDLASSPEIFQKTPEISTILSSSAGPIVADIHGSVFLLDRDFQMVKSWIAHVGGRVTHMAEGKGILVTLGEEDSARHPLLKVWDLEHPDKKTGAPMLMRSTKVQSGNRPHPVSTIALSAALSYFAVGLGDGTVLLYRHLDQSIFSGSGSLTTLPKPRVIHESPTEPITGLGFKEPSDENPNVYLFIVTTNRVLSYQASGKGSGGALLSSMRWACGLGCATMDWHAKDMVVAKDEAIYIAASRLAAHVTRMKASAHEIYPVHFLSKTYMQVRNPWHTHTATTSCSSPRQSRRPPPRRPQPSATSQRRRAAPRDGHHEGGRVRPREQVRRVLGTPTEGVRDVFSAWGQIYVLSNDGKLLTLEEKPTSAKLEMLYRRSLYVLALNIAETQRLDDSSIADIHRQYGDHLYSKGDYDGAMQQFVKTIGHIQPSYVIRKFLDAQRIHNLVTYLQELHALGLANSDHTTLLLNTYTKLKDVARLDSFIKREARRASADGEKDELPFDLDTAIRVCRQAGYFEHASYLAKKYERHEDYLRIQIEDAANYKDALTYLRRLGAEAAESNLARYGRAMLDNLPEETTQLLIDICTSLAPLSIETDDTETIAAPARQSALGPSYLAYLALNRAPAPTVSQSSDTAPPSSASMTTVKPGDAIARRESLHDVSRTSTPPPPPTPAPAKAHTHSVKRPSPRLYFAHFIDHMDYFSVDAAAAAAAVVETDPLADEQVERREQAAVWNTLLELYLAHTPAKALAVLESAALPYDPTHALILCSTRGFTDGLVLLWERMGMHEDVLRFFMDRHAGGDAGASAEVVRRLGLYGAERPQLYTLVLRFLTSSAELLTRHTEDVREILRVVDAEKIMPPLGVVQVLSRNDVASVGLVKEWLMARIRQAREAVSTVRIFVVLPRGDWADGGVQDEELIGSYRGETEAKLRQVEELSDPDRARVFHVTQCAACQGQLDLPSVHFMCNHSFHQRLRVSVARYLHCVLMTFSFSVSLFAGAASVGVSRALLLPVLVLLVALDICAIGPGPVDRCVAEHETECPNCARAHGLVREIRRNNERLAEQHGLFVAEVREGGFGALAAGFGRGALNMSRLEDVAA
ncbi:Vacuolar protein sorting-associated protein 11 [Grifola frondosa]|uniref:Vacuolar protein sorting-associated protein 11 n=1 Tax=Grifola frondosa TaxID=5627 RepID=A0A1C7LWM0_GRIFR|nr:Vacuolar protein sorting-associated protein 11 [Grifola frondosa]